MIRIQTEQNLCKRHLSKLQVDKMTLPPIKQYVFLYRYQVSCLESRIINYVDFIKRICKQL